MSTGPPFNKSGCYPNGEMSIDNSPILDWLYHRN